MDKSQIRQMAASNAYGRLLIGATLVAAPSLVARTWIGGDGDRAGAKVLARALGVRDIALGAGLAFALSNNTRPADWAAAAALADTVDAGATLAAWDSLPGFGRITVLAVAAGSAVQMGLLSRALDR